MTGASGRGRDLGAELVAALGPAPGTVVIAWSGGVDSTVLLDLAVREGMLREHLARSRVVAAHLDHAMREDSAEDAVALKKTAGLWEVEFVSRRLDHAPTSEAEARSARYAFLRDVCDEVRADQLWTGHHADDQIETVLFRIARGTGVEGLAGVPARRDSVVRPFLLTETPILRSDLEVWASGRHLPIRIDTTNAEPIAARNRLRHEVLPLLEEVVPGTRPALIRLSRNARRLAEELEALGAFCAEHDGFEVGRWAAAPAAQRRGLLRFAASRLGVGLSEAATRAALRLDPELQSGRGVDLPGGLRFERVFDRWVLRQRDESDADLRVTTLSLREPEGTGVLVLRDRRLAIRWCSGPAVAVASEGASATPDGAPLPRHARAPGDATLSVDATNLAWPLLLRGWVAGDRLRRSYGTSSVAKLWSEARIPAHERLARWVLLDATGRVLAAEGLGPAHPQPTLGHGSSAPGYESSTTAIHIDMEVLP